MWQAKPVHRFRRQDSLRRLADEQFDVLVIGGGVTGAWSRLRRADSRGLKTALVEKDDFAGDIFEVVENGARRAAVPPTTR